MLSWVINEALDRTTIVKLCNTCGVTYAGMRTKSMPSHTLVSDLAKKVFDQETAGEMVMRSLMKASGQEISDLQRKNGAEIKALPEQGMKLQQRQLSHLIVATLLDNREDVQGRVPDMLSIAEPYINGGTEKQDVEETTVSETFADQPEIEPSMPQSTLEATQAEMETLRGEAQSEKDECVRLKHHNSHLEKRVERLREKVRTLQIESDRIRHENRELTTTLSENDREIQRLTEEHRNTPTIVAQLHHLERENRKLRYDLEKEQHREQSVVDFSPMLQTFEHNINDVKGVVQAAARTILSEHEGLRHTIDELHKEVHTLRVEARKDHSSRLSRRQVRPELERIGIFVDVQNMFYAARQHSGRLDFEKLMQAAVGDRRLIKAVAYVIQTPEVDQTGFVAMLQQRSYQVRRKDLRLRSDGSAKGDWDMGMAIDMIGIADKLDVIVLVSGDGDFVSLVNLLKEMGPRVEVFSFPHNTARDLMEVADRYYPIDDTLLIKMDRHMPIEFEQDNVPGDQPGMMPDRDKEGYSESRSDRSAPESRSDRSVSGGGLHTNLPAGNKT